MQNQVRLSFRKAVAFFAGLALIAGVMAAFPLAGGTAGAGNGWVGLGGPHAIDITALHAAEVDGNHIIFAGTTDGVYFINDVSPAPESWEKLSELPEGSRIADLVYIPETGLFCVTSGPPGHAWAMGDPVSWFNIIWRYDPDSDTWEQIKTGNPGDEEDPQQVSVLATDGETLYAGNDLGEVWACVDPLAPPGTVKWDDFNDNLATDGYRVTALAYDSYYHHLYLGREAIEEGIDSGIWYRDLVPGNLWEPWIVASPPGGSFPEDALPRDIAFSDQGTNRFVWVASGNYDSLEHSGVYRSLVAGDVPEPDPEPDWVHMTEGYPGDGGFFNPALSLVSTGTGAGERLMVGVADHGVYILVDGLEWDSHWGVPGLTEGARVTSLVSSRERAVAGLALDGVYFEHSAGLNGQPGLPAEASPQAEVQYFYGSTTGLPENTFIYSLARDPENGIVYAGSTSAAFSYDGSAWTRMDRGLDPRSTLFSLAFHDDAATTVPFMMNKLMKYDEVTRIWFDQEMPPVPGVELDLVHVDYQGNLYLAGQQVYRLVDETGWITYGTALPEDMWVTCIDSDDRGNVYITGRAQFLPQWTSGMWTSNGPEQPWLPVGTSWPEPAGTDYYRPRAMALDNSYNVYVGGTGLDMADEDVVYRSAGGTGPWTTRSTGLPEGMSVLAMASDESGNILAAMAHDDIYILPAGGTSWRVLAPGLQGLAQTVMTGSYYAGSTEGVSLFQTIFTVTASVDGTGGTVNPAIQEVAAGDSATIYITPDEGYQIASITNNGTTVPISNPYVISNVTRNHAVVVTFRRITCTVTASVDGAGGKVSPATQQVSWSDTATINITPDEDYEIASITDNGISVPITNPYSIQNVRRDHDVVVAFVESPVPGMRTFYFAEGYTGENFQTYLCLGNAGDTEAEADVTYLFPDGTTTGSNYLVSPNSRTTVDVNEAAGAGREVSIKVEVDSKNVVAERPMYFNYQGRWPGGSDAVGATSTSKHWYFAEGNTLPEFDQYVTVLNPGDDPAELTFRYQVEGEGEVVATDSIGANTRATFSTRAQVGDGKNLSLLLESDRPVVAERPMYFNYQGLASHNWTGGHNVMGVTSTTRECYFAEGYTGTGFEEWVCIQNPNNTPISVTATYQFGTGQGEPVTVSHLVPASERRTISVNQEAGPDRDVSVKLSSADTFIAERPMYFNYTGLAVHNWTGGHDVMGVNAPAETWFFAEGYTGAGFEQWFSIQNPNQEAASITITYYPEGGSAPITRTHRVDGRTRLTVPVNTDAGANLAISSRIESTLPVIVERPMYFNFGGWAPGGHTVSGFAPGR